MIFIFYLPFHSWHRYDLPVVPVCSFFLQRLEIYIRVRFQWFSLLIYIITS